jgi:hypothetical protein
MRLNVLNGVARRRCSFEAGRGNLNSAPVLWTGHQNVTVDAKYDGGYDIRVNPLILRARCV